MSVDLGVVDLYAGTPEVDRSETIFTRETRDALAAARKWHRGWWKV